MSVTAEKTDKVVTSHLMFTQLYSNQSLSSKEINCLYKQKCKLNLYNFQTIKLEQPSSNKIKTVFETVGICKRFLKSKE